MLNFLKRKKKINKNEDVLAYLSADDAVMAQFKAKAQDELWYLIEFMEGHAIDDELFRNAVKTRFSEGEKVEHMWVQVNEFKGGYFMGKLANEPSSMKLIKYGDCTKVLRNDVEDWILQDFLTGTHVGRFSSEYVKHSKLK